MRRLGKHIVGCYPSSYVNKHAVIQSYFDNMSNMMQYNIKHHPIRFGTQNAQLQLFMIDIELSRKNQRYYVIQGQNVVMVMVFIPDSWDSRKTIHLNFQDICQLLQLKPKSNNTITLSINNSLQQSSPIYKKQLQFKDNPQLKQILIKLSLISESNNSQQWQINTSMNYIQYQTFYNCLEKSLYNASGMKLCLEIQKQQKMYNIVNNSDV